MLVRREKNAFAFSFDGATMLLILVSTVLSLGLLFAGNYFDLPIHLELAGILVASSVGGVVVGILVAIFTTLYHVFFISGISSMVMAIFYIGIAILTGLAIKKDWCKNLMGFLGLLFMIILIEVMGAYIGSAVMSLNNGTASTFFDALATAEILQNFGKFISFESISVMLSSLLALVLYLLYPSRLKEE